MPTPSDGQYQDFGAIEAAVRETGRGRAFLAHFARRVQQSDTLTVLAMLSRLERVSNDLASRLSEIQGAKVPLSTDWRDQSQRGRPMVQSDAPPTDSNPGTMERIEALANTFGQLHRQAVDLASPYGSGDAGSGQVPSYDLEVRAITPPETALQAQRQNGEQNPTDEDVLDNIAKALGPTL